MRILALATFLILTAASAGAETFADAAMSSTDGTVSGLVNAGVAAPQASNAAPKTVGGTFDLVNQNGGRVTDANFRGSYMLVTFGYTRCGDSCAPAAATMVQALAALPAAQSSRVLPVFVTLDPTRDTPAALKAFLAPLGPLIVGLTGSPGAIDRMARSYAVSYRGVENPEVAIERSLSPQDLAILRRDPQYRRDVAEPYTLDHTTFIYLMDPDGQYVTLFNGDLPAAMIAAQLATTIK